MESSRKGQLFDRVFSVIFKGVGVLKGRFSEKYGQTLPKQTTVTNQKTLALWA